MWQPKTLGPAPAATAGPAAPAAAAHDDDDRRRQPSAVAVAYLGPDDDGGGHSRFFPPSSRPSAAAAAQCAVAAPNDAAAEAPPLPDQSADDGDAERPASKTVVASDNDISNGFVKDGKMLPYVFEANDAGLRKRSAKILPVCGVCGKKFVCVTTMKRHLVTHTGEKPFSCKICSKQYTQKGNLRVHERTHRNDRPFECNICHQKFYRKEPMQKHQWRQHGVIHYKSRPLTVDSPTRSLSPHAGSAAAASSGGGVIGLPDRLAFAQPLGEQVKLELDTHHRPQPALSHGADAAAHRAHSDDRAAHRAHADDRAAHRAHADDRAAATVRNHIYQMPASPLVHLQPRNNNDQAVIHQHKHPVSSTPPSSCYSSSSSSSPASSLPPLPSSNPHFAAAAPTDPAAAPTGPPHCAAFTPDTATATAHPSDDNQPTATASSSVPKFLHGAADHLRRRCADDDDEFSHAKLFPPLPCLTPPSLHGQPISGSDPRSRDRGQPISGSDPRSRDRGQPLPPLGSDAPAAAATERPAAASDADEQPLPPPPCPPTDALISSYHSSRRSSLCPPPPPSVLSSREASPSIAAGSMCDYRGSAPGGRGPPPAPNSHLLNVVSAASTPPPATPLHAAHSGGNGDKCGGDAAAKLYSSSSSDESAAAPASCHGKPMKLKMKLTQLYQREVEEKELKRTAVDLSGMNIQTSSSSSSEGSSPTRPSTPVTGSDDVSVDGPSTLSSSSAGDDTSADDSSAAAAATDGSHHGKELVECQCKTCGNIFGVLDPFNFKCANCHVKYTSLPTHVIADPLQCIGCCHVFPHKPALKAHQVSGADKERPFICCKCGYGFRQKAHLQKHQWRIHRRKLEPDTTVKEVECMLQAMKSLPAAAAASAAAMHAPPASPPPPSPPPPLPQIRRVGDAEVATIRMRDIIDRGVERSMRLVDMDHQLPPVFNAGLQRDIAPGSPEQDANQPLDLSPVKNIDGSQQAMASPEPDLPTLQDLVASSFRPVHRQHVNPARIASNPLLNPPNRFVEPPQPQLPPSYPAWKKQKVTASSTSISSSSHSASPPMGSHTSLPAVGSALQRPPSQLPARPSPPQPASTAATAPSPPRTSRPPPAAATAQWVTPPVGGRSGDAVSARRPVGGDDPALAAAAATHVAGAAALPLLPRAAHGAKPADYRLLLNDRRNEHRQDQRNV